MSDLSLSALCLDYLNVRMLPETFDPALIDFEVGATHVVVGQRYRSLAIRSGG